ncbi:MAG: hypothetical protein QM831_24905 [Kofleriaceae bacterium]
MIERFALCVLVACGSPSDAPAPPAPESTAVKSPANNSFGLYVLALSWAPSFCCGHPDKEECANLTTAFAGTHLTLHGLWPNYTDDEARGRKTYPEFCGSRDAPDPSTIPDEMQTLGPGYVGDHDFLADHEWPKHGTCTGLQPREYFQAALDAMKKVPTPDVMQKAIGGDIATADLESAFGVPANSVLLSCDRECRLSQVSFCLAHDAHNVPTTPIACPRNTTTAQYDNGCVTRGCDRIKISEAGRCDGLVKDLPAKKHHGNGLHACNHPGQGPSCSSDSDCTTEGFTRCAKSGCCTNQP